MSRKEGWLLIVLTFALSCQRPTPPPPVPSELKPFASDLSFVDRRTAGDSVDTRYRAKTSFGSLNERLLTVLPKQGWAPKYRAAYPNGGGIVIYVSADSKKRIRLIDDRQPEIGGVYLHLEVSGM